MGNRKLSSKEKAEKKRRKALYTTVFVGGKQKRVKRSPQIEGLSPEEFLKRNGSPIALHQDERWEEIPTDDEKEPTEKHFPECPF